MYSFVRTRIKKWIYHQTDHVLLLRSLFLLLFPCLNRMYKNPPIANPMAATKTNIIVLFLKKEQNFSEINSKNSNTMMLMKLSWWYHHHHLSDSMPLLYEEERWYSQSAFFVVDILVLIAVRDNNLAIDHK